MNKIFLIIGMVAGGIALLLLSVFMFLAMQGKLNMQTLTQIPILGGFFGKPPVYTIQQNIIDPEAGKEDEEEQKVKHVPDKPPEAHFTVEAPYTVSQLDLLVADLQDALARTKTKAENVEKEKKFVAKQVKELEERWIEVNDIMEKAARVPQEAEKANYATIIEIIGKIKEDSNAATIIKDYDVVEATEIILGIFNGSGGPKKAGSILVQLKTLDPDFAEQVQKRMIKLKPKSSGQ